jgi:hypothetical protein
MRPPLLLLLVTLLGLAGCGAPNPQKEWPEFGRTTFKALQAKDIEALVKKSSNLAEGRQFAQKIKAANPGLDFELENKNTEAGIASDNRRNIMSFLETHAILLKGEAALVGVDPGPNDDFTVIIWVKHDGKYRGLPLQTVLRTARGLVVSYWGSPPDEPGSVSKTKVLEADTLEACKSQTKQAYEL